MFQAAALLRHDNIDPKAKPELKESPAAKATKPTAASNAETRKPAKAA